MTNGMKLLSYVHRLKKLKLFSVEKRRLKRDLTAAFQYLEGAYKRREREFLLGQIVIGDSFKLKGEQVRLGVMKKFVTWRVVNHWNK